MGEQEAGKLEYERPVDAAPRVLGCGVIAAVFLTAMMATSTGLLMLVAGLLGTVKGGPWWMVVVFLMGVGLLTAAGYLLRGIDRAAKRERAWRNRALREREGDR